MNPRWAAWLRAEGPSLPAWRFLAWISDRWAEWAKLTGHRGPKLAEHHAAFDAWLDAR